jgi:hypothetical protein
MPSGPCCISRSRMAVPLKQPNGAKWTYLGYLHRARWAVVVLSFVILTILGKYRAPQEMPHAQMCSAVSGHHRQRADSHDDLGRAGQ